MTTPLPSNLDQPARSGETVVHQATLSSIQQAHRGPSNHSDRPRGRGRGRGRPPSSSRGHIPAFNRHTPTSSYRRPATDELAEGLSEAAGRGREPHRRRGRGRGGVHHPANRPARSSPNEPTEPDVSRNPPLLNGSARRGTSNGNHTRHPQNQRRQNFGAQLTEPTPQLAEGSNSNQRDDLPLASLQSNHVSSADLSLSARLTLELSTSNYECLVCFSTVTPFQPIYHCPTCFVIFHLRCSSEWASRSVIDSSTRARLLRDRDGVTCSEEAARGSWRCPGCQERHIGEESVPTTYRCWCGKVEHPKRNSHKRVDAGQPKPSVPHGCGLACGKVIADGCVHNCALECHPGSCPPCPAVIETFCHCHQTKRVVRCSQLHPIQRQLNPLNDALLSCGQVCNRELGCELHLCTKPCHAGDCGPCEVMRDKSCYCGTVKMTNEKCSALIPPMRVPETVPKPCHSPDGQEWLGEFSCKAPCPWKFDCDVHACLSTCHIHLLSTSSTCPLSPLVMKTCPCGATPLISRSACTDPIATCDTTCSKLIPSCGHVCRQVCHTGPCGPCQELVTTVCRCGKDSIIRSCGELQLITQAEIEAAEPENGLTDPDRDIQSSRAGEIEYQCERICRVLRHCGKHTCNRVCCPLSFLEGVTKTGKNKKSQSARQLEQEDPSGFHQCNLICKKKLNCGLHVCQLRDHKGPCPSCLQANFDEVICHCRATVLQPPVPCGMTLNCNQPCRRGPLPCGHPKAPHHCHEEAECPPCPFLTNKPCQCDKKNVIRNVRCSQPKVTCGKICGNLLSCGAHRCRKTCHATGQCETCEQVCLKPRKNCGHGCQLKCHAPSACSSEEPCEVIVDVKCRCGYISQKVKCSSCDNRPEGNRDRLLKCNNDCVLYQRNLALASAFVDEEVVSNNPESEIEWNAELLQLCYHQLLFVKLVESSLEKFLKSQPVKISYLFQPQNHAKRKLTCEMAEMYGLSCECLDQEPRRSVKVTRQPNSQVPKPLLSEAFEAARLTQSASSVRAPSLKTNISALLNSEPKPKEMNALLLQAVFGHDTISLRSLIQPTLVGIDGFELIWVKDEDVIVKISTSQLGINDRKLSDLCDRLKTLLNQVQFCTEISLARVDDQGRVLDRTVSAPGAWKSVGSAEGPRNRWDLRSSAISVTNSFDALTVETKKPFLSNGSDKAKWTAGTVLGGGFNRPPTAVLAPVASTSRVKAEDVVDDWEDSVPED